MAQFHEFATNHWELFLALAIILALLLRSLFGNKFAGYAAASPQEVVGVMNQGDALIVDIRTAKDFEAGHILNARNMPLDTLAKDVPAALNDPSQQVVVYCKTGQRSAQGCRTLKKAGVGSIYNLEGGIHAGQNASLPLPRD